MAKKGLAIMCVSFLTLFVCAHVSAQTQTGSLSGTVTDQDHAPLPGAEVSVTSPALMGIRTFLTRVDGSFRFPSLPTGIYVVKVKIVGFQGVERPGVVVSVGVAFVVNFELKLAKEQVEVTVTAPSPAVDTKSSKQSTTITTQLLQNLPVARTIYDIVQTAPSVIGGESSMVSVHGASLVETRYMLDGVDITDPLRGYKGAEISFDAVEEIEFVLSGGGADVGKASAGFINIVTKSGGNAFSGGLTAVYTGESLFSNSIPSTQLTALKLGNPIFDKYNFDLSGVFGGPIIKDRLWFFVNPRFKKFERGTNFIPFTAGNGTSFTPFTYKRDTYDAFGKLTAQITNKLKYMVMFDWYKYTEEPYSWWFSPRRAWTYGHQITYNPITLSNVLNYIIDENTFADLRVGYVNVPQHNRDFYEIGKWPLEAYAQDRYYGTEWGLIPWNEDYGREKIDFDLTVTRFLDNFLGANHQIKIGAAYSLWTTRTSYYSKAPYYTFWYKDTPWYYNDTAPYTGLLAIENMGPDVDSNSQLDKALRFGLFFEDVVSIGKRLTLNLGVRYDRTAGSRPEEIRKGWFDKYGNGLAQVLAPDLYPTTDTIAPAINNEIVWARIQPRLGFNLDLTGDGKTSLKGNYARYQDDYVADMATGSHAFDPWQTWIYAYWVDSNRNGKFDLPPVDAYTVIQRPASLNTDPAQLIKFLDPNLSSPYVDEFTLGIQRELFKDFNSGLTFIYREHKNIPEQQDTNNPIGGATWMPYTVTEPGFDGKLGTGDDKSLTVFAQRSDAPSIQRYRTNISMLKGKYWGIEWTAFKRMSDNWQFSGSVTYSKTYGNIGGGWGSWKAQGGLLTNPNNLINLWGRTNYDRPLLIKLMGTVVLPYRINLSGYFVHMDGTPTNRTITVYFPTTVNGVAPKATSVTVAAEPPGSIRNPSSNILNLRLEKEFKFGPGILGLYVDAFNVLGFNRITVNQDSGGYIYADKTFSPYATYGKINTAEGVQSFLFTMRYHF